MNYIEWAEEYELNALRVKSVMDHKKQQMNDRLTADERKQLLDQIKAYRRIYYDLLDVCETLRGRARVIGVEA